MGNDMLVGMGLIIGGLIASCYGLCPATSRNSLPPRKSIMRCH
jgi:hypothetical protein